MKAVIHEMRIRAVFLILRAAVAVDTWASAEFKRLIGSRSAAQVSRMERRKGLL